ncbi:hypothetical protein VTK26DRAFT_9089 [Humicola hyalothermophila]
MGFPDGVCPELVCGFHCCMQTGGCPASRFFLTMALVQIVCKSDRGLSASRSDMHQRPPYAKSMMLEVEGKSLVLSARPRYSPSSSSGSESGAFIQAATRRGASPSAPAYYFAQRMYGQSPRALTSHGHHPLQPQTCCCRLATAKTEREVHLAPVRPN